MKKLFSKAARFILKYGILILSLLGITNNIAQGDYSESFSWLTVLLFSINQLMKDKPPIRAYITNSDLKDKDDKDTFLSSL